MTLENHEGQREEIGLNHNVYTRPIDPQIIGQMPQEKSKTFIEVTFGGFVVNKIKKAVELVIGYIYKA